MQHRRQFPSAAGVIEEHQKVSELGGCADPLARQIAASRPRLVLRLNLLRMTGHVVATRPRTLYWGRQPRAGHECPQLPLQQVTAKVARCGEGRVTLANGQLHEQPVQSERGQADRRLGAQAIILRGGGQEEIEIVTLVHCQGSKLY